MVNGVRAILNSQVSLRGGTVYQMLLTGNARGKCASKSYKVNELCAKRFKRLAAHEPLHHGTFQSIYLKVSMQNIL